MFAARLRLLEYPGARGIPAGGALRLQAPRRGRKSVGILELTREVRAVRKACLVGDVGDRAVGVLDQPVGVALAQLAIQRGRSHSDVLTAQTLELSCGQAELGGHRGDRDGAGEILL